MICSFSSYHILIVAWFIIFILKNLFDTFRISFIMSLGSMELVVFIDQVNLSDLGLISPPAADPLADELGMSRWCIRVPPAPAPLAWAIVRGLRVWCGSPPAIVKWWWWLVAAAADDDDMDGTPIDDVMIALCCCCCCCVDDDASRLGRPIAPLLVPPPYSRTLERIDFLFDYTESFRYLFGYFGLRGAWHARGTTLIYEFICGQKITISYSFVRCSKRIKFSNKNLYFLASLL